ncbi:lysylphosphatidylglycerol synthase domain-containing protein [Solitalea koreensis]|nr:lysylphosphatidylglycerol synthase domain-containing protein [Solitalea koreensis]
MLKPKNLIVIAIKVAVLLLTFWFVYSKVNNPESVEKIKAFAHQPFTSRNIAYGIIVLYLMYLNVVLETLKWHFLANKVELISWKKALESVLAGLTLAVFTPSRVGEFGGRVLYLAPQNRVKGVVAMGIGSFSQMMVTNVFGAIGLIFFVWQFIPSNVAILIAITAAGIAFSILILLFYFNVKWFYGILHSLRFLNRFKANFRILLRFSKKELFTVFGFSTLRYAVFSMQYYLLINLFIPGLRYPECMMMISIIYMVQSILPTFALLDLGVRGAAATYFFGFLIVSSQVVSVLAAAFGVWIVNIIIPAIIGVYFILKVNFFSGNNN